MPATPYPHSYTEHLSAKQIKRGILAVKRHYSNLKGAEFNEQTLRDEVGNLIRRWRRDPGSVLWDVQDKELNRALFTAGIDIKELATETQ